MGRFGNADARRDADFKHGKGFGRAHGDGAARDVAAVVLQRDAQRARELAGSVGRASDSGTRLKGANQHATGGAFRLRHDVEAVMDAVNQVNIGVARRAEQDACAGRQAAVGVSGRIGGAQIGFGLDDAPGGLAMRQDLAQQRASHLRRRARIKRSGKNRHYNSSLPWMTMSFKRNLYFTSTVPMRLANSISWSAGVKGDVFGKASSTSTLSAPGTNSTASGWRAGLPFAVRVV